MHSSGGVVAFDDPSGFIHFLGHRDEAAALVIIDSKAVAIVGNGLQKEDVVFYWA